MYSVGNTMLYSRSVHRGYTGIVNLCWAARRQFRQPLRLHQPGNRADGRRDVRNHRRAARAPRQLAADRGHRALRLGAAPLRYAGQRCHWREPRSADADDRREDVRMIRWVMWLLGGIVLGGMVHLATVLALPTTATRDAYSRLTPIAKVNTVVPLGEPAPATALLPFMDPAFAVAVCRYDLSAAPLKLTVPVSQAYTSTAK